MAELATPTQAEFDRAVTRYRPFVLRGLAASWPSVAAGRQGFGALADHLLDFDGGRPLDVMVGQPSIKGRFFYRDGLDGFNFERGRVGLRSLLARLADLAGGADPPSIYAGAANAPLAFPGWVEANPLPLATPGATARLWIGNASRASAHYDLSGNIAVVVAGRRRFALFPPEQGANLYVGPLETTPAGQPVSLCDLEAPDLDRFPLFARALDAMQVAELEPGDAIYIPSLWWHDVRSFGPFNLLANYWFGQTPALSPFPALIHAILAIRDLPESERAAVKAWFDQYVFAADVAGTLAHIPADRRGVLGPASPARDAVARAYLRRTLER